MTLEIRTFALELEEREDGRTLTGLAVPYDTEAKIGNYIETFRRGAFADTDPAQVPLMAVHDRETLPIGRALRFTEDDAGLQAELRVSKTAAGDDVLELIRDGAATGLSVGFVPVEDSWNTDRTRVERIRAKLVELSVTAFPAYREAKILAIRAIADPAADRTPLLSVARRRL
ncbi:MAG: HK97 family phage prohead protease [Actinomycetota bacterium]|nr:HK97 family phage prohead protease [Actinomycetota bacterium]